MKKIQFTVTVEFADKINDDNEILEIADNIGKAIVYYAQGSGIAPEYSDTYTKSVMVKPQFLDEIIELEIK